MITFIHSLKQYPSIQCRSKLAIGKFRNHFMVCLTYHNHYMPTNPADVISEFRRTFRARPKMTKHDRMWVPRLTLLLIVCIYRSQQILGVSIGRRAYKLRTALGRSLLCSLNKSRMLPSLIYFRLCRKKEGTANVPTEWKLDRKGTPLWCDRNISKPNGL